MKDSREEKDKSLTVGRDVCRHFPQSPIGGLVPASAGQSHRCVFRGWHARLLHYQIERSP